MERKEDTRASDLAAVQAWEAFGGDLERLDEKIDLLVITWRLNELH